MQQAEARSRVEDYRQGIEEMKNGVGTSPDKARGDTQPRTLSDAVSETAQQAPVQQAAAEERERPVRSVGNEARRVRGRASPHAWPRCRSSTGWRW